MKKRDDFLPILLASDINAYSMARAFHEQYGIKSLMVARGRGGVTGNTNIVDYYEEMQLDKTEVFLETMDKIREIYGKDKKLLLIGCADHYVRLIVENKEYLKKKFIVPYSDKEVLDNITLKESFYANCEKYNLDYPKTFIYTPDMNFDFKWEYTYPVILKASDSVSYHAHKFEGFEKVYTAADYDEMMRIMKLIYSNGYNDNLIIQERIPGDDFYLYDLQMYVGSDHKMRMMNMGHVLLEEHTPTAVGNNCATLVEPHPELMKKVQYFMESIGYEGFADADIKLDSRDGKFKMFEINIRQGRSHYRVTGGGDNLAELVVSDYIDGEKRDCKYVTNDHFWHVVPLGVVYKYVKDPDTIKKIKKLVKEGKTSVSSFYNKDMNPKRWVYLKLRDINFYRKFKRYY